MNAARRAALQRWLDVSASRFATELQLTNAAVTEQLADGVELDWLAARWRQLPLNERREEGEAMSEPQVTQMHEPDETTETVEQPSTLPAVREPTRLDELRQLGYWLALAETDADTEKAKGAAAALRLYYAQELGLTPVAAAELSMIRGKLVVSARLLRALALRNGYRVLQVELDDVHCTAALYDEHAAVEVGSSTFTIEDARTAGLIRDKSAWKTHPRRMLWARASANVVYDYAPDVALGLITEDEAREIRGGTYERPVRDDEPLPGEVTDAEVVEGQADLVDDLDIEFPAPSTP